MRPLKFIRQPNLAMMMAGAALTRQAVGVADRSFYIHFATPPWREHAPW
jgi:hypothetical protein